jgi:hypothetical protein
MPWTQADVDALKQAIVDRKGARSIAFSDQVVTFESVGDMVKLLSLMQAEVTGTSRTRYAATSKGV